LIQLYTFQDEVILDPFVGSGSTCVAALKANRSYVGYDIEKKYVDLAERRVKEFLAINSPTLFEDIKPNNLNQEQSFLRENGVSYGKKMNLKEKQPRKHKSQRNKKVK